MDPPWIDGPPDYRCECGMLAQFQCPLCKNIYCGNCGLDCACCKIFTRARGRRCSRCKVECDPVHPSWRVVGDRFEHRCQDLHPQAGHFEDEEIDVRGPTNCDVNCSECAATSNSRDWRIAFLEYAQTRPVIDMAPADAWLMNKEMLVSFRAGAMWFANNAVSELQYRAACNCLSDVEQLLFKIKDDKP